MLTEQERQAVIKVRLEKAEQMLIASKLMKDNQLWSSAINRMYYACYYVVSALLIKNAINATTHAGVRQMLNQHFVKEEILNKKMGHYYSKLFSKRQSGDYDDFLSFDKEEVEQLSSQLYEFIDTIKELIEK